GLDPVDGPGGDDGAVPRIFGEVLERAPVPRVTGQVDAAGQLDVETTAARLLTDRLPGGTRQCRVEARAQRDARGHRGRGVALPVGVAGVRDAHARVAHVQRRYPEAGDPGRVRGTHQRALRDALVPDGGERLDLSHDADDEREPLVVGQLLLDLARALVGR